LQLPECGWCESTGTCAKGTDSGPIDDGDSCPSNEWMFTECPSMFYSTFRFHSDVSVKNGFQPFGFNFTSFASYKKRLLLFKFLY
jgi:Plexin repeat.